MASHGVHPPAIFRFLGTATMPALRFQGRRVYTSVTYNIALLTTYSAQAVGVQRLVADGRIKSIQYREEWLLPNIVALAASGLALHQHPSSGTPQRADFSRLDSTPEGRTSERQQRRNSTLG